MDVTRARVHAHSHTYARARARARTRSIRSTRLYAEYKHTCARACARASTHMQSTDTRNTHTRARIVGACERDMLAGVCTSVVHARMGREERRKMKQKTEDKEMVVCILTEQLKRRSRPSMQFHAPGITMRESSGTPQNR